jgi:hypothetical protein
VIAGKTVLGPAAGVVVECLDDSGVEDGPGDVAVLEDVRVFAVVVAALELLAAEGVSWGVIAGGSTALLDCPLGV